MFCSYIFFLFFFFNDTATTEIYTLSLHDALPICRFISAIWNSNSKSEIARRPRTTTAAFRRSIYSTSKPSNVRSEEHTSELQSRLHLVCRLLLEKKKKKKTNIQNVIVVKQHEGRT